MAVIGSVYASLYRAGLDASDLLLDRGARATAKDSIGAAIGVARRMGIDGTELLATAQRSFFNGFQVGCLVAAGVLLTGAIFAAVLLPARPSSDAKEPAAP